MYPDKDNNDGFTMVELVLAMGFVSALLLAIAMTVIQIGTIFNRGLAMKAVDQVGSEIASKIQTDVNNSSPFSITASDDGIRYVNISGIGGRLCLSSYTYIWNYGEAINASNPGMNFYNDGKYVKFIKIPDSTNQYCKDAKGKTNFSSTPGIDKSLAVELLDSGQYNLAIHDVVIETSSGGTDTKTNQQLYFIKIALGSNVNNTYYKDSSTNTIKCYDPSVALAGKFYDSMCYISDFSLVVRAGNKVQ